MSGKPATPAVAGAPRLLLYVAEPALADSAAAPDHPLYLQDHNFARNALFRAQLEHDQRNHPNTVFYKPENGKVVYGDSVGQRTEYYPVPRQYCREPCLQDDSKVNNDRLGNAKRDGTSLLSVGYEAVESFQGRLPTESELYQQRCLPVRQDAQSMQTVVVRHNQNQYSESVISASETNLSDRELQDKGYVNYQFLEQNVTHQSIVNQGINILNQQVGVNRSVASEESGPSPQLVRTPDGVVLAVLPPTVPAQHALEPPELSSRTIQSQSDSQQTIVPLGWTRIVNGSSVVYVSPSGTALSTLSRLREYLQTTGTCKCGLPCPLRPETFFSFDPQVPSKPYQTPTGAELTRLCNHKRKLLATLAARAQAGTPPPLHPEQRTVASTELAPKKKMKKRAGYPNMSVSQLMVQRDRPAEFKTQDIDQCQGVNLNTARPKNQPCLPYGPIHSHQPSITEHDKPDAPVQRSSHYLTVNSGWIQQESIDQKNSNSMNPVGMPVLGTNGQIIGVNTGYNKHPSNFKSLNMVHHSDPEKDDKKDLGQSQKSKEEEAQIFCGLNQPLTPEVMQKINEQQQLFIQQNQKQIEMAMKGFRTQLEINQNKSCQQNQYMGQNQGQLVIQNGAVVKSNSAKTPPWQVKRPDNPMTSPSPKSQKSDSMDYEEPNTLSEESSNSNSSFHSDHNMSQAMCSRVPPLPQHYNMMGQQWPGVDMNKKKPKAPKVGKKKAGPVENKQIPFGNNGMRLLQDAKGKIDDTSHNNLPSFMDDPNGYLAQQTVLLNNTINRQVGINSSYDGNQFDRAHYGSQVLGDKSKVPMKHCDLPTNMYRNNMVPNASPSPHNTPDSSLITEKNLENSLSNCCKGYNAGVKQGTDNYAENQMRRTYARQNMFSKMDLEGNSTISSPKHSFEDSPVTSSTFIDRSPLVNDNCGPIQAATVSTSNVSPTETLPPPEPSPTPSNSSRNADTPHSNGGSHINQNCTFPMPSPAYSNPGSCREFNSNPSTPLSGHTYPYSSPGPPNTQSLTGTQMMHFISNHNVNKNLMEVDNISMVGVKPQIKAQEIYRTDGRKRVENSMPGYCPPPHLGSGPAHSLVQACYVQTFVTNMASGFSVTRDTVTSVLAGKANTTTTSINASQANFIRPSPPPSVNLATTYAIPNNHPDPFIHSVTLPTSYPLHIAGTTAQNMISKSPLEMVQNVIGNLPTKSESQNAVLTQMGRRPCRTATPGQILISSTGQIMVSNSPMPPPPPKTTSTNSPTLSTNVTASVTQVIQSGVQPVVNQPAMVVNTLQAPFVIQPPMMAVDGPVVQQNTVLPQLVAGGIVPNSPNDNTRQIEVKNGQSFVQGVAMLSPESLKRKSKKKKSHTNVTNVLQITAPQQNASNIMVHHTSPQHNTSPQFSPRGFQLSPNNNISPGPMLQALTIVPGKSGTPAHIVMNGQGNGSNYGSQQIITNTSPSQQINLLQPVNLINNGSGVVSNFPAFQQFIVPNLGGMVMTADGAIIQDNAAGVPMQLQLQTVNGQNVLTPVQNPGVFAGANGGVVIRAQNQQGKIIQSQHSPGAQFLSPNNQVMMSSPNFNGQLSPLLANLSPTSVTFNTSPHQVRSGNVQTQEFIQTNQMGQTLMVPLSPKQVSIASATANRSNSTFVQQNTTIVQQQTTLVSNSHNGHASLSTNLQGGSASRLSIDPNVLLNNAHKLNQLKGRNFMEMPPENQPLPEEIKDDLPAKFNHQPENEVKLESQENYAKFMNDFNPMLGQMQANVAYNSHVRHSVSTQTLVNQQRGKSPNSQAISGSSPPDTTTHSPLGALESTSSSPRMYGARSMSTQGNYADTTTKSPEPVDANSSAMVQCVSSSEPDIAESREHAAWSNASNEFSSDSDTSLISNIQLMRQTRHAHSSVESTEINYSQNLSHAISNQQSIPMAPNYYDRQTYKRKNEFTDNTSYRNDKLMRTSYNMVHGPQKDSDYDLGGDKTPKRHFSNSGSSSEGPMQKVFDRHNLGNDTNTGQPSECKQDGPTAEKARKFEAGDLIWGPVKGYASWPGKLVERSDRDKWTVRWFGGDKAVGSVEDARLLTLSEGLEAHHAARTKHRKSRKLNTLLENAIQEAMAELDKKTEGTDRLVDRPTEDDTAGSSSITDTPKRCRKEKKAKAKLKKAGNLVKIAPNLAKAGDGTRLRSSR